MRSLQWYKRGAAYFGLRTELNRKLALFGWGAETTFLCPTDFTDLHRFSGKRLRVKCGEEWRKLFTRASFKVTDVYVLPVKSEECF